jgi:hypothetical protein
MPRLGRKQFTKLDDATLGFDVEWQPLRADQEAVAKRAEAKALYVIFLIRLCRGTTQSDGTLVA